MENNGKIYLKLLQKNGNMIIITIVKEIQQNILLRGNESVKEKITVLISDDNREFAKTLCDYLEKDDEIEVVGMAKDGEEALSIITTLKPQVVLLDVIMPHLDGIGVLEKLNAMNLDNPPICIMLSAVGQDKITQKAIGLGAQYYVIKPFDIEILSIAGITEDEIFIAQTDEEMEANAPETAPIMTLSPSDGYSKSIPVLFDLDAVLLPIYFNIGDDSQEVFKKHKLVLACNMSEVESGSTELTLYLRHDKGTDDEKQYYTGNWYAFNLRSVIAEFTVKAGNIPTKLIIKAHEDLYQTGKMPEDYTTYEIEYEDPAEQTSQN